MRENGHHHCLYLLTGYRWNADRQGEADSCHMLSNDSGVRSGLCMGAKFLQ